MIVVQGGMIVEIDGIPCEWVFHETEADKVLEE